MYTVSFTRIYVPASTSYLHHTEALIYDGMWIITTKEPFRNCSRWSPLHIGMGTGFQASQHMECLTVLQLKYSMYHWLPSLLLLHQQWINEISKNLCMRHPVRVRASPNRQNIYFSVQRKGVTDFAHITREKVELLFTVRLSWNMDYCITILLLKFRRTSIITHWDHVHVQIPSVSLTNSRHSKSSYPK